MIASFIGNDVFFKGMCAYLERHKYGNAVTIDLWRALEEASNQPVVKFMIPWTKHVGFPIVQLSDDGALEISRFLGSGPEKVEVDEPSRWPIPVTARVQGETEVQGPWVLHGPDGDQSPELSAKIKEWSSANKWFKLNVDQTGFFRVAYTHEQWERLAAVMDPADSPLSTTDRLGLLSDSFAAGRAGYSPIVDSLTLVSKFGEHETAGECFFGLCEFLTLSFVISPFFSLSRICSLEGAFRQPFCSRPSLPFVCVLPPASVVL
jgi:aminopeptidase 2